MFTGIIEELGQVKNLSRRGRVYLLSVKADKSLEAAKIGDSIAVNGTCLTLVGKQAGCLDFEVMEQTFKGTNLSGLKTGDKVNLERSLKMGDRISGHFVTGHVDCLGVIRDKGYSRSDLYFEIAVPVDLMKYILPKGSVAVDGISLTVAEKKAASFKVCIIPHTAKNTTLGSKDHSGKVNIEFDILAKRLPTTGL